LNQSFGPLFAYCQPPPKNQPQKPLAGDGRKDFCFDFMGYSLFKQAAVLCCSY
jgi:hypothetical protein